MAAAAAAASALVKTMEHSNTAAAEFRRAGMAAVSLVQVLNQIDDHFLKASEGAQEVSKMLEATHLITTPISPITEVVCCLSHDVSALVHSCLSHTFQIWNTKASGAFAVYLEPWHADIFEFLDLRRNHGKEEHRARDLFYALWVPDFCSWNESKATDGDQFFPPVRHQGWQIVGVRNSKSFTLSIKHRERPRRLSRLKIYGLKF